MYRVLRQPLYYICIMKLIKGEFKEEQDLLFAPSIKAGFPSPAEDYLSDSLDFNGDLMYINEEFNIKQLDLTHKDEGYIELRSGNPKYPTFRINEDDHFQVWGVVVYTIKKWK